MSICGLRYWCFKIFTLDLDPITVDVEMITNVLVKQSQCNQGQEAFVTK